MFLKLPNALLEMQMQPNAFKVLCALLSAADQEHTTTMRTCVIAQKCNISIGTVCSAIRSLENMGLVRRVHRHKEDGTLAANRYLIALPAGKWFAMSLSDDVLRLPASSFSVYAAMLRFRGKNHKAFPSLGCLSNLLGLCKNTLLRALRCLQASGLLRKMAEWAGKHNLYLIQGTKNGRLVEQKPDTQVQQLDYPSNTFSVTSVLYYVKRAVVHFLKSIPLPTWVHNKKSKKPG